jgi:hypothetical protein
LDEKLHKELKKLAIDVDKTLKEFVPKVIEKGFELYKKTVKIEKE